MWTYSQRTGTLTDANGVVLGHGYSGRGTGLNNPDSQDLTDVGPCPQGLWSIVEFFDDPGGKGPIVSHLSPLPETDTYGRTGFMIHGDNSEADHTASEGCLIFARPIREALKASADRIIEVIA